jgi:hypothetical protein
LRRPFVKGARVVTPHKPGTENPPALPAQSQPWLSTAATQAVAVAVVYTMAVVWFAWTRSYFVGDDFSNLWIARTLGFRQGLLVPLGGQIVPLHRAVTFVTYRVAPMSFAAALGVLVAFHAIGVAYLYRILELVGPGTRVNVVLTALYATHMLLGLNLTWFTSGMTRFPYIAFSLAAMYHYLVYCDRGKTRSLALVCACYFGALGFYSKGILVPLYCVAIDFARRTDGARAVRRDPLKWSVLAALIEVGVAYIPWAKSLAEGSLQRANVDPIFLVAFLGDVWTFFISSLFDRVPKALHDGPGFIFLALSLAFVAWSIARRRSVLRAWLALAVVISANILMIGASPRTVAYGRLMAFEFRHYYELSFLTFVFLGIVIRDIAHQGPLMPRIISGAGARVIPVLTFVFFAAHALLAYRGLSMIDGGPTSDGQKSRRYMRTLIADLDQVRARDHGVPTFIDGAIPRYLDWMDLNFRLHSQLFLLLDFPAQFRPETIAKYHVGEDGHVVPRDSW